MRIRRTFTPEFKLEAASLVLDQGYSILQACRALDVGQTALKRWVDQLQFERTGQSPTMPALTAEQREIQQLKARIHQLEQEKMILKKATALLMSDEFKHMR
ncbi:transposase [Acinetobacter wanghuae]|nr:transposase [Acinetobacter wanghuae]